MNIGQRVQRLEAAANPQQCVSVVIIVDSEPFEDRAEVHGREIWRWCLQSSGHAHRREGDPYPKVYIGDMMEAV